MPALFIPNSSECYRFWSPDKLWLTLANTSGIKTLIGHQYGYTPVQVNSDIARKLANMVWTWAPPSNWYRMNGSEQNLYGQSVFIDFFDNCEGFCIEWER